LVFLRVLLGDPRECVEEGGQFVSVLCVWGNIIGLPCGMVGVG
jgi:hypothetical protein